MANDLTRRQSAVDLDSDTFRAIGHRLVDDLAALLARVPEGPVTVDESPTAIREAIGADAALPEHGIEPAALASLMADLAPRLFSHSLFNAHPRFFGYITASPTPIGILGDFLASALNANVGSWTLSPAATELELQTVRWMAEFIGYPVDCGGLLVSGGNMANIVGFLAARADRAPWDVRVEGIAGGTHRQLIAYASAETHTWIQKAADICGLGTKAIRWIPTDAQQRMDVEALRAAIRTDKAAGHLPFLVVGTAGSVSTGVVDPLAVIADICTEEGAWFHVDGAYGGFAAAVAPPGDDLRALARADSVAVDPHKWLYAPLEAGCALVRRADALRKAFSYHPPYYHFDQAVVNLVDYGPQNSRGFRALKVWLAMKQAGASGYRQSIQDDIALSQLMASEIAATPELELMTQHLSITTFRYVPSNLPAEMDEAAVADYLNEVNRELLDRLQRGGRIFVSNAVIDGRYVLRACIVNFHTSAEDVLAVPRLVVEEGRRIHASRRQAATL